MILLFFWGEIYMKASIGKDITKKIWSIFAMTNIIMYSIVVILFALDFSLGYWNSIFEIIMILYESCCYIVISFGLPIWLFLYGYYIYRSNYWSKNATSPRYKKLLRRIGIITIIIFIVWFTRSLVLFTPLRFRTDNGYGAVIFFGLFEIIPGFILLGAYIEPRKKGKEVVNESTALFINDTPEFP